MILFLKHFKHSIKSCASYFRLHVVSMIFKNYIFKKDHVYSINAWSKSVCSQSLETNKKQKQFNPHPKDIVEVHGLLHGIHQVLFSLGVQRGDVLPGRVQVLNVLLHLRFVRLSAQLHQVVAGLSALVHFRFGLLDLLLDFLDNPR